MTGIATSWDRHWVGVTWWTAAMATGWIVIAVLVAGLPDLTPPGRSRFPTFFGLLPAGLAALGATLYVAIAATAVVVIIVPVSAGPGQQEPTRRLAQAVFTLFFGEGTAFIAAAVAKVTVGDSTTERVRHSRHLPRRYTAAVPRCPPQSAFSR